MRPIPLAAVTAGLALGICAPAFFPSLRSSSQAGTAIRMDLDETFQQSDLVVEGTVRDRASAEDENGLIYTDWEIDVARTFWGDDRPRRTVRLPGGVLSSGKATVVPGMPRLSEGEDVVLLLGEPSVDGLRMPVGLSQGKYRLITSTDGNKTAVQTGDHVSLISARSTRSVEGLEMMDYADLVSRIESAAQTRRATEIAGDATGANQDD